MKMITRSRRDLLAGSRGDGSGGRELAITVDQWWLTLAAGTPAFDDIFSGASPGLWKAFRDGNKGHVRKEFHVPGEVVADSSAWDPVRGEEVEPLAEVIRWAQESHRGRLPRAWSPPSNDELSSIVDTTALTVEVGNHLRQGSIVATQDRLAVEVPLLHSIPDGLSTARREWLDVMLTHVQRRSRMARIVRSTEDGVQSVRVEVDLTGAPHAVLPDLLRFGSSAVRTVASWFITPLVTLADPAVSSSAWEVKPERIWSAQRKEVD